jgi:hypothetical protein
MTVTKETPENETCIYGERETRMVEEVFSACFASQTTGVTSANRVLLRSNGRDSLLRISCVSTAPHLDIEAMSVVNS